MRFRLYIHQGIVVAAVCFSMSVSGRVLAQDAGKINVSSTAPGTSAASSVESNAMKRRQYFHMLMTYPGGSIPAGAQSKAWKHMHESMKLYNASGRSTTMSEYEWKNKGPFNIGGRITTIAVNHLNPNTIIVGTGDGGIWRSFTEGKSWHPVSDEFPTQVIGKLVIDPSDTNVVYAGTGDGGANFGYLSFDGEGLFKSTDGGSTWFEIGTGTLPQSARIADLVIDPSNSGIVYAAVQDGTRKDSADGVWKSIDAGETWQRILHSRPSAIVIDPLQPEIVYVSSSRVRDYASVVPSGIFKSTDAGASWEVLVTGVDPMVMGRTSIALCPGSPEVLYLGMSELDGTLLGVYKSTDAGASWAKLSIPFNYFNTQGWYDNVLGVHPTNPDIVFAGGVHMLHSTDGGSSWQRVRTEGYGGKLHVDQHAIIFNPLDPETVYVGNDGGFFLVTEGGTTVEKRDYGLSITQFIGGAMHPTSDDLHFGGTQDNGTIIGRDTQDWNRVLTGDGGNTAVSQTTPNLLYTSRQNIAVHRSEDFGITWTQATVNIPDDGSLFYIDYVLDPRNHHTLYLGSYRVFKTTTGGRSWSMLKNCLFPAGQSCYYISSLDVPGYDSDIVLAGSAGGGVAVSTDKGVTWNVHTESLPAGFCSSVQSFTPGTIYATYSRYGVPKVWKSTSGGITWTSINGNLPDIPVYDLIESEGKIIIGTLLGAFISEDDGQNWQLFGTGMPAVAILKLVLNQNTGTLRAISHGRGIYDMQWLDVAPAAPVWKSLPDTSALEQKQAFTYAPVVTAVPPAVYHLLEAPPDATIDSLFGLIRWTASGNEARFVVEARNEQGAATQSFDLTVNSPVQADWVVTSAVSMPTFVSEIAVAAKSLWALRDSGGVSRSTDGGIVWIHKQLPGVSAVISGIHAFDDRRAVIGSNDGRIFRTTDGGDSWRTSKSHINARFMNFWFWDETNGMVLSYGVTDTAEVYKTFDGGDSWTTLPKKHYSQYPVPNTLRFFDAQYGLYASYGSESNAYTFRTIDGGTSWTRTDAGTREVSKIAFLTPSLGFAVDAFQSNTRRTVSGGQRWLSTFWPMNGSRLADIAVAPNSNHLWVFSDSSAWVSRDEGTTWMRTTLVPTGKIQTVVFADSVTGWAVSRTGIVQKLNINPLVASDAGLPIPQYVHLGQIFPNPVTAGTDAAYIPLNLPSAAHILLKIYNTIGKEVATLADRYFAAGEHIAVWNPGDAVGGVYFAVLVCGTQRTTGSFIVVR